jgi:two-component system nitrogen regulation response regulator GlnG
MGDRTMGRDESPGPAAFALRAEHSAPLGRADSAEPRFIRENLIGESESFSRVLRKIPRLASSDATVLITGETGTGKEVVAKSIHLNSHRREHPFIPVNCGALPEDLVENELFGHARGAYTGAAASGKGLLAEAEGGTLFLDELNSLSLSAQAKLLRFLQNREYRVLGSTRLLHADVRIVAATNVDLGREISAGNFRADLYHRLHVLSVEMPPLRLRREDVPLLAEHFAQVFGSRYDREEVHFHPDALAALQRHDWPGNVRELQNCVRAAVYQTVGRLALSEQLSDLPGNSAPATVPTAHQAFDLLATIDSMLRDGAGKVHDRVLALVERELIVRALRSAHGNQTHASEALGLSRVTLRNKMRELGIVLETVVSGEDRDE